MSQFKQPQLYTFRRCPYAIRTRLAVYASRYPCDEIQVDLKNKPKKLLELSPKGTVPVLVTSKGEVIDESMDIIQYVLAMTDDEAELLAHTPDEAWDLIKENDTTFKQALDRHKYPDRFEDDPKHDWFSIGEAFLTKLDRMLRPSPFLYGDEMCVADIAIFPFVRQYRAVNMDAFDSREDWDSLHSWVNAFMASDAFIAVMEKKD